jgi:hypothetical protein
MAFIYISEYSDEGMDAKGRIMPCAKEPAIANQRVAVGLSSTQSAALNANTTLVRINTDVDCCVLFGLNPTATTSSRRMAGNQTEYFAVQQNSGLKIAVIEV